MSQPSWGEWFEDARAKTKEFAGHAQIMAVAATIEFGKQAHEFRDKIDLDAAASAIMTSIGGVSSKSSGSGGYRQRSRNNNQRRSILDLVYITENLISMSFPHDYKNGSRGNSQEGNDINIVSKFLKQKHGSHFMIWNVSEDTYDYTCFGDQVLEYSFPGHPAPPLGLLFNICTSVESWLDADEKNVAVIHCLTGKGRTATLMACILTWIGESASPLEALQYVSERRGISMEYLTIPSQRRYVQYFSSVLTGAKPLCAPLRMVRIIMNTIPNYSNNPRNKGCCPYIQIFQCGKLIATAASHVYEKENGPLKVGDKLSLNFVNISDGSVSFLLDCHVQGDLLLRCRHVDPSGTRVSIFRAAFHTGYIPPSGVLRLCKGDLDGACSEAKFQDDFFIDMIFSPLEESTAETGGSSTGTSSGSDSKDDFSMASTDSGVLLTIPSAGRNQKETLKQKEREKDYADKENSLWDSVTANKLRSKKRRSRKFLVNQKDQFSISDEMGRSKSGDSAEGHPVPIVSSVSNEELIMQIARLELDEGKDKSWSTGIKEKSEMKNDDNNQNNEEEENEEGENEDIGNEAGEYDEDYYVSLDDIYPQEIDFVTINNMTVDEGYQQNVLKKNDKNNKISIDDNKNKDDNANDESIEGTNPMAKCQERRKSKLNDISSNQVKKEIKEEIEKKDQKSDESKEDFESFLNSSSQSSSEPKLNVKIKIEDQSINHTKSGSGVIVSRGSNSPEGLIPDSGSRVPTTTKEIDINTHSSGVANSVDMVNNTDVVQNDKNVDKDIAASKKKNATDSDELDELERYLLNLNG